MLKNSHLKTKITNITGIVLAAGSGKRMGCTKQLLSYGGQSLIERIVCNAEASNLYQVIVVLGCDLNKILKQVKFSRSFVVSNPNFKYGQSSSVRVGLVEACKTSCNAAMFILGDQPLITSKIINRLIKSYLVGEKNIVVPTHCGKRGNPVIFSRHFFPELKTLTGDIGGRGLIKRYENYIIEVTFGSDAILFDLDTSEDYYNFSKIMRKNMQI